MRLLGFYVVHTFKNCIKKLFKTWVALLLVFIVACGVIGGFVGYMVGSNIEDSSGDVPGFEEEVGGEADNIDPGLMMNIIDLSVGGVILVILLFNLYSGDNSGASIFTMPDVNFLFTSPMKPQSVLMFRVLLQMGLILVGSVYIVFQLPNLILNLGLSPIVAVFIVVAWAVSLILGKLVAVCTYTVTATHTKLKKFVKPLVLGIVAVLAVSLIITMTVGKMDAYNASVSLFASGASRFVPVWGWMKGFIMYAVDGNFTASFICLAGVLIVCAIFAYAIWQLKADFYEDALAKAAANQEKLNAIAEGRNMAQKRSSKIKKDGINHGSGSEMFFIKTVYNRRRFAKLGFLTNTSITYFLICAAMALLIKFVMGTNSIFMLALILLLMIFIRNYGNPISSETERPFIYLVPGSSYKKLLFSVLSGTYETFFDLLPAYVISAVFIGADPVTAILWLFVFISLDLLSSTTGLLIEMLLPTFLAKQIKAMLQMILKMLAVLPLFIVLVVGMLFSAEAVTLIIASVINLVIACGLFFISPYFLHKGRS